MKEKVGNPYTDGLELVRQHSGTSGQVALAKCILSLYNPNHAFSIGEILGPLDLRYTKVVLAMVNEYAIHGETQELIEAGEHVYSNFPRLVELSIAMSEARSEVYQRWEKAHQRQAEEEDRRAEERRLWREENSKDLHCTYCERLTQHLPMLDGNGYECNACYTTRPLLE